jgi:hypothetical protein
MPSKTKQEEVGDLFVTQHAVTVKLMPSKKSGSRPIRWFEDGCVTNVKAAAKDIAYLIGKLQGSKRIVKRLTVMTDGGVTVDLDKTGLPKAVEKAGFSVLR